MNRVILMGRPTKDPEVKYTTGETQTAIARFTLAVDRRKTQNNPEPGADFIGCVAFGSRAEFIEKYIKKGTKILVTGRLQTGSYTNKDGQKVYTQDVVIEDAEFAESKKSEEDREVRDEAAIAAAGEGFVSIPDGIDEELPFT